MGENDVNAFINDMSAYRQPQRGFHGFRLEKPRIGRSYEKVLAHWDIPQGANVLEIGAGLGEAAEFLHILFDANVVQSDISLYPLILQRRDPKIHTQTNAVNAAALNLPFANHYFDAIHMKDVFVHIEDQEGFFKEMHRLLKPRGKLLIVTQENNSIPYVLLLFSNHNHKKIPPEHVAIFDSAGYTEIVQDIKAHKMIFRGQKVIHISPPYFNTDLYYLPRIADRFGFMQENIPYFAHGWLPPKNEPDWTHTARKIFAFVANPSSFTTSDVNNPPSA